MAAQVTFSVSITTRDGDEFLIGVPETYDHMRKKNLLCDVVLEVQGRRFPAHRLVLAACSQFFFLMFTTGMKESTSDQVELKGVEPDIVEQLINYIYTKRISLNVRNVQSMLMAADLFLMDSVKMVCVEFLQGQMHASNCLGMSTLADLVHSPELAAAAEKCALRCFSQVVKSEEFLKLDVTRLTVLLKKDTIVVVNEKEVFTAAMAWLKHDLSNRQRFLADVLSCVRFAVMSKTFLLKMVNTDPLIQSDAACLHMVIRWMHSDLAETSRPRCLKRTPCMAMLMNSVSSLLHFINPKNFSCTRSACSIGSGQNAAMVHCDGVVYILGGSTAFGLKSIRCYSIQQDCYVGKTALPTPCNSLAASVIQDNIYVSGGLTTEDSWILQSLHCYDTKTNSWQTQPNMLNARCSHGSVEVDGFLYVCGGLGSGSRGQFITNSCEVYNPSTQQWRELCPMTIPRKDHGLVVVDNQIYAIGGEGQQGLLRSVERYDVSSNQWHRAPPLPYPMRVKCAAVGNTIFVLAGRTQRTELQSVLEFHVNDRKWISSHGMTPCPFKDVLVCVVD